MICLAYTVIIYIAFRCSGGVPNNEVRVGLLHDEFLRANVLLLPCVDNVPFLQDLHGEGFVLVALELNLRRQGRERNSDTKVGPRINPRSLVDSWRDVCEIIHVAVRVQCVIPAQLDQSHRPPGCQ